MNDPRLQKALSYIRAAEPKYFYEVSLQTLVLCAANPKQNDLQQIQKNVDLLEKSQIRGGRGDGGWSYQVDQAHLNIGGDGSNTEFAIWALDEAAKAGAKVRRATWQRARDYWKTHQNADGSWGYTKNGPGTGSMTCSGIVSLAICLRRLADEGEQPDLQKNPAILRGWEWMAKHFATDRNPGSRAWTLYYLMVLSRAGNDLQQQRIGDHDWHQEGIDFLLQQQDRETGRWRGMGAYEQSHTIGTSFALLFLRGHPVQAAP